MTTSVVIPAYNGKQYLQSNLPAVMALKADEVIIVDDASTDDTLQFLEQNYPQSKIIRHDTNRRFPISVNDGFKVATGDVVFLLNQDVWPQADLIKCSLKHFANPQVFAVTFNENGRSWAKGEWMNGFFEYTNGPLDNKIHESAWASGGSAAFRRDVWNKLGGFDTIFTPGYLEDLDLGLRATKAGYKIIWDPQCKVEHVTESAYNKAFGARSLRYFKERNNLLAMWRNMPQEMWLVHIYTLTDRIFKHPGYMVPFLMAIWKKLLSS